MVVPRSGSKDPDWRNVFSTLAAAVVLLGGSVSPARVGAEPDAQAGCDPGRGGCPLAFGKPASAVLADPVAAHLWWIEVAAIGRFHIIFFDTSATYHLSVWGPGGSEVAASELGAGLSNTLDIAASEAGLYVLSLTSLADGLSGVPYLLVPVWDATDRAGPSSSVSSVGPAAAAPYVAAPGATETAPARVAGAGTASGGRAPQAPSRLRAALTDSGDVRLDWKDNSDDETGFRIAFSDESDPVVVEANRVVYRAQGASGTSPCFRVQAFNGFGASPWSPEACVGVPIGLLPAPPPPPGAGFGAPPPGASLSAPPSAPRGLRARTINHNTIRLDWTDTADNETGFQIDGTAGFFVMGRNATTRDVGGLQPNTSYCFRVFAFNDFGQSGTNEACATTFPPPPTPTP